MNSAIGEVVAGLRPVDHHVHGSFREDGPQSRFTDALNEGSTTPLPGFLDPFESQLGYAVLAHCAPLLDLPGHAGAAAYLARRAELGEVEVSRRLLSASGTGRWLVDTGHGAELLTTPAELAALSGSPAAEIVRLEPIAESLIAEGPQDYPDRFRAELARRLEPKEAVGLKTVLAYRAGFDIPLGRPSDRAVQAAAQTWARSAGAAPRLVDPVLLAFGIWAGVDSGKPLQLHTGFGDRDLDLHRSDPLLLLDFLRALPAGSPVILLHCYPFERHAGYLAQAFADVYFDVGLAVHYLGARGAALVGRSLELAPFAKLLYSSDGWGAPELHFLGSHLWRSGLAAALDGFIARGEWSLPQAERVARLVATENAERVYQLPPTEPDKELQ